MSHEQQGAEVFCGAFFPKSDFFLVVNGHWEQTLAEAKSKVGDVNRNGQKLILKTEIPGTDHQQRVWQVHCEDCGNDYGANGSDFFQRKCPRCQGGQPGLNFVP